MTKDVGYCKTCFHVKDAHEDAALMPGCSVLDCECESFILGETRVTSATGAEKGTKDARYDLIPVPALDYLARLYGFGAKKYAEHNWRLGYDWSKSYAAAQRHMAAFWSGEDIDPESGAPHVINAAFHMFALATFLTEHPELDDRFETRESRPDEIIKDLTNGDLGAGYVKTQPGHEVTPEKPVYVASRQKVIIPQTEGVKYVDSKGYAYHVGEYSTQGFKIVTVEARPLEGFWFSADQNTNWTFEID